MNYGQGNQPRANIAPIVSCGPPKTPSGTQWPFEMQHTHDIVVTMPSPPPEPSYSHMQRLCMRTGWSELKAPFHAFHMLVPPDGDKVLIWLANSDGTYVVLEDDKVMFPSDGLVTKLTMLQKGS